MLLPSFRSFARLFLPVCIALVAATSSAAQTTTSVAGDGFDPNVEGNVLSIAHQNDGKVIIAGSFTSLAPNGGERVLVSNIARLNVDGTIDRSFAAETNGPIRTVVIDGDNFLIGGDFTIVNGVERRRLARLSATGALDASFNAGVGSGTAFSIVPQVLAITLQDGNIVVGGTFGTAFSTSGTSVARNNLVRFTSAGAIDNSFNPNPNGMVLALAVQPADSKLLVGGSFTQFNENGSTTATTRLRAARLNANGSVDATFDPRPNNGVIAFAVQRDGKFLMGGYFTNIAPNGGDTVSRNHVARFNANGTLDTDFTVSMGGNVNAIAIARDGGILIGGRFAQVWGRGQVSANRSFIARFSENGTVDEAFSAGVNFDVAAVDIQPDGKVVLGGYFTRAQSSGLHTPVVRNHVARFLASGALDTEFQIDEGGRILASVTQPDDDKIIVAGSFTTVAGEVRNYMARLTSDGRLDATYTPVLNGAVYAMSYNATTKKLLIGGAFTKVGSETRNHIARLNADGTLDTSFSPSIDGLIGAIAEDASGKILVGGLYTSVKPTGTDASTSRYNMLRLNADGTLDTTFNPAPNGALSSIIIQPDGKILIGGSFTLIESGGQYVYRNRIARLNADGSADSGFDPNPSDIVNAMALQSDGKILIGGRFRAFMPNAAREVTERPYLARINVDGTLDNTFKPTPNGMVISLAVSNGKILVGGGFTTFQPNDAAAPTTMRYVARLNSDGTLDTDFNLNPNEKTGDRVDSIAVQPKTGNILIGGTFTSLMPTGSTARVLRNHFARITPAGQLDTAFDVAISGAPTSVIRAMALQSDGKVLVGGTFSSVGGSVSSNIARFSQEGHADTAFNATISTDGDVNAIGVRANGIVTPTQLGGFAWLQPNGTLSTTFAPQIRTNGRVNTTLVLRDGSGVIIGGNFADQSGTTNGNLMKFDRTGRVDATFKPKVTGTVYDIAEATNGDLIVVGTFNAVDGTTRNNIARLKADGSLDTTFDPNSNGEIRTVLIQSDESIIIGGTFSTLSPNGATVATTRNNIARLTRTGVVDTPWDPNINGSVNTLAFDASGKLLVGGSFTLTQPNGTSTASTRNSIARFEANGNLDASFDPNVDVVVNTIVVEPEGTIVIGGSFTTVKSVARSNVARLNADGTLNTEFTATVGGPVYSIARTDNGSLVLGGAFTTVTPTGSTSPVFRNQYVRLLRNGAIDTDFNPDFAGQVLTTAVVEPGGSLLVGGTFSSMNPTGVILVGGSFNTIGGLPQKNLAQLNANGTVNAAFAPNPNGRVHAIVTFTDGRFIVGGEFTQIAGAARPGLARFESDGRLDTSYNPSIQGSVAAMAAQPDGKLLVSTSASTSIIRLEANGSHDATFSSGLPLVPATAILVQPDGKILVAGPGSGVPARIARLNADGSDDASFTRVTFAGNDVRAMSLQADGSILVAGSFTSITGVSVMNIARLSSSGVVDPSFKPAPNGEVSALAVQSDGRVFLGGKFTKLGDLPRPSLARISGGLYAVDAIGVSGAGTSVTWLRRGSSAELSGVTFDVSTDSVTWTRLGDGKRVPGTSDWNVTGVNVPLTSSVYLRARGIAPSGSSTGVYETVRQVNQTGSTPAQTTIIGPVITGASWNEIHYVWTQDAAGVLRIADRYTNTSLGTNETESILNGQVPTLTGTGVLADISTRATVTPNDPLIGGFTIDGSAPRAVLVRAIGPGLAPFGVANHLRTPEMVVYNSAGTVIATVRGWNSSLSADFVRTGAFPLTPGSADCATILTLAPGSYTVHVVDAGTSSTGGDTLVEVYDAGNLSDRSARLINLSSRGTIPVNGSLTGGLVVSGNMAKTVLVRGVGPGLSRYNVNGVVADPVITVYDSEGKIIVTNDDWQLSNQPTIPELDFGAAISSAATRAGAFQFTSGSKDAALVITLPAGAYTVQVTNKNGAAGAALIEFYELP